MIKRVSERANEENLINIKTIPRDFVHEGSGLQDKSVDYVMLFNILHAEDPENILKEASYLKKEW